MYQNYFGFKERPFQLVPNPAYLFLSSSHEEAMAHLTYAVSEGDGFIALTGEVGTGKTTLCRAFIENLDDRCEVAYIFNPKLTAIELLHTISDEFGIAPPAGSVTKDLIDRINRYLLEKKSEGKQVMLIIDEAQNLSREVLEQIRLLSNLETNTEKLLQIVLVGQPEMSDVLDTYELRQLSQRITLNCHLNPLTRKESVRYIQHRIRIAAPNSELEFSPSAFKKIYAFSKGVPRLIHIICNRALLAAFVMKRKKITGGVVDSAIRELRPRRDVNRLKAVEKRKTALLAALLCLIVFLLVTIKPMDSGITPVVDSIKGFKIPAAPEETHTPAPSTGVLFEFASPPEGSAEPEALPAAVEPASPHEVSSSPPDEAVASHLTRLLTAVDGPGSKQSALVRALALWGLNNPIKEYAGKELIDPETYLTLTARENGFQLHRMQSSLTGIYRLNLPAIFEFRRPDGTPPQFLTLSRMNEGKLTFFTGIEDGQIEIAQEDVGRLWSGLVYIPWKNFYNYEGITPISGSENGILLLKQLLKDIGYEYSTPDAVFDARTASIVKEIQGKYGLPPDGLVGPLTKMALYNELPVLEIPHIRGTDDTRKADALKVTD